MFCLPPSPYVLFDISRNLILVPARLPLQGHLVEDNPIGGEGFNWRRWQCTAMVTEFDVLGTAMCVLQASLALV